MGKIIFWIVVFFVVLLALRLVNLANQKARRDEGREAQRKTRDLPAEPTVRCVACGTYLPKADAKPVADGYRCPDPGCTGRR
jgi:hypothetical protein